MRNLITAAALLAAGTALANAAAVTDVLTTTFSSAGDSTVTSIAVTNDPSTVSASVTSLTSDGSSDLSQMTGDGTVVSVATIITPNTNVGTGGTWTLTLSYTIGSDSLTISGVTLDTVLFNSSGSVQNTNVTRYFDLTLTITDSSNSVVATYAVSDIGLTGTGAATASEAVLSGAEVTLDAGSTYTVTLTASQGSSNNSSGCYIGLAGITYTYAVPEPSAFGMLAGVGALALVAARRRRTRKAA